MNLNYTGNEYQELLGELYAEIPKAVLAAIAVSLASRGGDYPQDAKQNVAEEWEVLHTNGIVPQKPGPKTRASIAKARA